MSGPGSEHIYGSFGQIKSAGVVIEQSNNSDKLHDAFKDASAMPVEFWRIAPSGAAKLILRRVK